MKNFQDLTVSDYLKILRRRIWYLLIPTLLISAGTIAYVWRLPSWYKSETTIMVSERFLPEEYIGSMFRQTVVDRIEFAKQQLRSRTFVERIAQEFQLVPAGADSEGILNAVINSTEFTVVPPNLFKVGFYSTDPTVAQGIARRLAERVMQANDAGRQERVTVADQFLEEQVRQAVEELGQIEQKLREFNQRNFPGVPEQGANPETLTALQTQLAVADTDLQNAFDQKKAYERTLAEQRDLKVAAKTSTAAAPTPAAPAPVVTSPVRPKSQTELKLIQKKADFASALGKYTPQHPDVLRLQREIRDLEAQVAEDAAEPPTAESTTTSTVPDSPVATKALPEIDISVDFYEAEIRRELALLDREIAKKQEARKELANRAAVYGRRMNAPPAVMQELATLTQDREAAKQRYSILTTKKLSSDLAGKVDVDANNKTFTTVDPPNLPQVPVRPDRRTLNMMGFLSGICLGILLVVGREILDPTLGDDQSAATELKLTVFTSIPKVAGPKRREKRLVKKRNKAGLGLVPKESDTPAEFSLKTAETRIRDVALGQSVIAGEQFQTLRAELAVLQRQRGFRSLVITSAIPNDGKTFTACCLAATLAKEQGKRVLLVDTDLRTASVGQVLGLNRNSAGLAEVLSGTADVENCLITCADLNLSVLPSGNVRDNPIELLTSPRLQQVMRELTALFDWVIVDSPPVLPIADATLVIPVCDAAVVVIRADKTPVSMIKESINKIGRDRICGLVMNSVRDIKSTYYYGHYHSRLPNVKK